jgi:Flp pilus assembly protein TadG
MSASKLKSVSARLHRLVPLRRFARRQDGAAAIEFAMVMAPFMLLMFLIMETALLFFAGQTLETAVADSARLIKTGQAQNASTPLTQETFKTEVCKHIFALFDCQNGMYVDVKTSTSFDAISTTVTKDSSGNPVTTYSPGGTGDIVVVRLLYKWPVLFPLTQKFLGDGGGNSRMLVATAAFRNEPF